MVALCKCHSGDPTLPSLQAWHEVGAGSGVKKPGEAGESPRMASEAEKCQASLHLAERGRATTLIVASYYFTPFKATVALAELDPSAIR